ncbi:hypothetical protein [Acinetobacter sp. NIPH 2699]|uniref:hypothetical protein n=1 Tax=Acinetobacter sp. NIPH 2699 TaxID=2923433 RepID=UPI001F4A0F57|nr:hypothetical protein [Acinetobacter sp. NIPH 2699]MCH7336845.1 hypothetical protein [Acinetobacter sp. NIPH 2699]
MLKKVGNFTVCLLFIASMFFLIRGAAPSIDIVLIAISLALLIAAYLLASEFNLNLLKWTK